jgi:hypothetical protein
VNATLRQIVSLLSLLAMPAIARAEIDPTSDVAVKAAFLYNFAKFTEWQSLAPGAPLTLCVDGNPRLATTLAETVRGQHIGDHPMDVRVIDSDDAMRSCAVLFISVSEIRRAAAVLDTLKTLPILTVADGRGFAQSTGIVELFVEDGRMRFAINTDAVDRAGLRLSSRLLGLARIVRSDHVR